MHNLRAHVIPAAVAGTGLVVHIGGNTATFADLSSFLGSHLPIFMLVVLGLSFLLLLVVFRSLVVPLKAVIMNVLSIGAAYGLLVAVFQWGWGAGLIGIGKKGPIESFIPMMMFAVIFGLSMDYEIFLLSRIKEEFDKTGNNAEAVADGLAHTARVITAAAAIMVCVFGSFVLGGERVIKEFGLGLAAAILIDATLVRMILVPATMELLGDANWWLPRWLARVLPKIHIEGTDDDEIDAELSELLERDGIARR
jgi:RND superfamily putative drug exporter